MRPPGLPSRGKGRIPMSILFAIICGIIQGAAEFLPVSSSGHLALFQNIFYNKEVPMTFDILLHLGTLIAVFIVYWRDIFPLVPAFFTMLGKVFHKKFKLSDYTTNERMVVMVLIGTVPLVIAAFLGDTVEFLSSYTLAVGIILILNSVMLYISDTLARGGVNNENVKPRNALVVGLCQVLAIMPGLSRSGTTITAGLTQSFDREFAVKYSFILSIPAIIGANVTSIPDILENPIPTSDVPAYIIGTVVALVCGVAAMKLLIFISRKANFRAFSYYTFAVGVLAIILGATGTTFPLNL